MKAKQLLAMLLVGVTVVSSSNVIFAAPIETEVTSDESTSFDEEDVNRIAEVLEYLCENAFIYDENGQIISIDFEAIRAKYGDSKELSEMESLINSAPLQRSFLSCMKDALLDICGVTLVGTIISGTVEKLITQKSWTELAKFLLKHIPGLASKYVGVAGLVASLVYYAGKCAITSTSADA